MSSPASYPMFSDGLMAAVDLSAGALKSPPFLWYSHAAAATATATDTRPDDLGMEKRKTQLLSFMDHLDIGTVEEHLVLVEDPYLNRYARPEPTKLIISDKKEDPRCTPLHVPLIGDETTAQIIQKLTRLTLAKLITPMRCSLDAVYQMYLALPEPRMIHVNKRLRHRLFKATSRELRRDPRKETQGMLRYLSLIGDVKDCGITIRRNEWNNAIAFATRFVGRTTETEVETALQMWKEMEIEAGIEPNSVTFNILFDVASKAGNFALAEMLYKEMKARNIPFNRYHHVSLIYFFGLQEDADGVRAAYKEMVEAGESVDTAVLNCVISGFLKCGEDKAVLRVYEYMKLTGSKHAPPEPTKSQKEVDPQPQQHKVADVTPDLRTYRILINHFGVQRGDLGQVAQFLDEMKRYGIPMHGSIFLALFEGFMRHGSTILSEWTPSRLESILSALLRALDNKVQGVYLDTWLMMWALRSFMNCTNKDRVLKVYEEFKKRWDLAPDKADYMDSYLLRLLNSKNSMPFQRPAPWQRDKAKAVRRRPYVKHS
ncbi:pentatricopeptide repeat domain-containing protein [Colletotrichum cereale]|nr:pentatricopeptide repeat domain-containing protein [Colletotrichum cereale]